MLISSKTSAELSELIKKQLNTYCSGLFLSARWFVVSQCASTGVNLVVLPDKDSAEYCASDLYTLVKGDRVFFLPDSGKNVERSNYKSSLGVQRTSAVGSILADQDNASQLFIVTYPEALEEPVPEKKRIADSLLTLRKGDTISHESIAAALYEKKFSRVDFVSAPGQFAIRGAVVDIFSYSFNDPFRISFFGDEVEKINVFDCNTQLSKEERDSADIFPDIVADDGPGESIAEILPKETLVWMDSSDMYREKPFYGGLESFRKVYIDTPLSHQGEEQVKFRISPQPVFNKNFELLSADIRSRMESGYKVFIYTEKESQVERLKSILYQNEGIMPEFIPEQNIHKGFIDNEDKLCCYTDHEIFDRFHRVSIRRTVEKSEQLTLNDLNSFNIGDYVVHIDHGVGVFGGLVRMKDDKGRIHEVVKLMYKDNDVVFVSVHPLHKIS